MAAFIDFVGTPKGAQIYIDGELIGELPKYNYMLKWGKYQIRAELEGYEPEERKDYVVWSTDRYKKIVFALKKIEE